MSCDPSTSTYSKPTSLHIVLVLAAVLTLSACSFSLAEDVTPPPDYQPPVQDPTSPPAPIYPAVAPDPAQGATLYAEKCAPCHGPTGLGDGSQAEQLPGPVIPIGAPDVARAAIPIDWFNVVTTGRLDRFMPPFESSLSNQERWNVLAYVFSFSTSEAAVLQGEALYQDRCANCHGDGGRGDGPEVANLSVVPPDFSDQVFMAERSAADLYQVITVGVAPAMPAYEAQLTDDERWALAAYLRTFVYEQVAAPSEAQAGQEAAEASPLSEGSTETQAVPEPLGSQTWLGDVKGWVVNGSGGELPANLEVTLHGFEHIEEVYTATIPVAEDGTYLFADVEMPDGRIFMVSMSYSGATYTSDIGIAESDTDALNLPVTVYETTTDNSMLVVDRLHLFLENVGAGSIQVTELYLISNPGDRVVVPPQEGEPVILFNVPRQASNLRFQGGVASDRFVETDTGFGDTMGVPPGMGQYQVMFAYDMPYDRGMDLRQKLTLPVNSVILLMPEMGVRVKSDRLQDRGARQIQGQSYRVFVSDPLSAEDEFVVTLSGTPRGSEASLVGIQSTSSLVVGVAFLGVALVITGVWLYRRWQHAGEAPQQPAILAEAYDDQESVLDAIIALDDLHRAGELHAEAYRQRRAALMEILREMRA